MSEQVIAVVDGQGGGIGSAIVAALRQELPEVRILALGTNSHATAAMLRAGAMEGASGENAVVIGAGRADLIMGVFAIVMPNSLLGELTPKMAEAIGWAEVKKVLLPLERCNVVFAMDQRLTIQSCIQTAVARAKELLYAEG